MTNAIEDVQAELEQTIAKHELEDVGSNCICGEPYACGIRVMAEEAADALRKYVDTCRRSVAGTASKEQP